LSLREIPAALTTITKNEIKLTGARSLPELLSILIPGYMNVQDEDDNIHAFRGVCQDNNATVLMLVNGQNIGFTYNYGLNTHGMILDLNHIDYIEVVSGPGFADFGQGPLTGVINIVTEDFEEEGAYIETNVNGGTGKLFDAHAKLYVRNENIKAMMSFAYFEQKDGFKTMSDDSINKWYLPDAAKIDSQYHDSRPGHALYSLFDFYGFNLSFYKTAVKYDVYHSSPLTFQQWRTLGGKLQKTFELNDRWSIKSNIHGARIGIRTRQRMDSTDLDNVFILGEESMGLKIIGQLTTDNFKLGFGADADMYFYGPNPFEDLNYQKKDTTWLPAHNRWTDEFYDTLNYSGPGTSKRHIVTDFGGLMEAYVRFARIHSVLLSFRLDYNDIMHEWYPSPKLSYVTDFGPVYTKYLLSHAYRAPMPEGRTELPPAGFWRHYSNPGLKTQNITNFEFHIGLDKDIATSNVKSELRYFLSKNRDIIQGGGADIASYQTSDNDTILNNYYWWSFANAGDILSTGVEAMFEIDIMRKLRLKVSHALVKALKVDLVVDKDLFVTKAEKRFLNFPENVTRAHITYNTTDWLALRSDMIIDYGRLQGSPLHDRVSTVRGRNKQSKVWFNWNLGAVMNFGFIDNEFMRIIQLSAHVFNILNSRPYMPLVFYNNNAYNPDPRSFKIGLTIKIK